MLQEAQLVKLNFYSKYNRVKEKQDIASLFALIDNTEQYIRQHGGLTRENGDRMRKFVLAPGGEIEAGKLFPNFSGYEAKIEPLLEKRGLTSK